LLTLPELHWHNWPGKLWEWFVLLGEPILIGLPLLACLFALLGYGAVRAGWRVAVIWRCRVRRNTYRNKKRMP
jgi:hypothetical protein